MATATISALMKRFSDHGCGADAKRRALTPEAIRRIGENAFDQRTARTSLVCVVAALATACGVACISTGSVAQSAPAAPPSTAPVAAVTALRITPEISLVESYTDNAGLVPAAIAKKSWVTESTPRIRIEKRGVRSKIYLDYRLRDFRYSGDSRLNNTQRLLASSAVVEAIDNWLFVDASANITQQNRSAFSIAGATDTSGPNGNRVETATSQISPRINGKLLDLASYQLRFVAADIRSKDPVLPDTKGRQWIGFIKNSRAISGFGWSLDGNALTFRNNIVGKSFDERIRGSLSYDVNPQIHVSAIVGSESTNFAGLQKNRASTSGFGLEWSPSASTQFAAVKEKRFFGDGHSVIFKHRTAFTVWSLTSNRDVTALPGQLTATGSGSTAGLLSDLLIAAIPDPIAREAAVRKKLEESGIPAGSALSGGFATGRPILSRTGDASVALVGIKNTVTLIFSRRNQRAFGPTIGATDSFSLSNDILQQGFNLNWAHRLSPLSSISLIATSLRTEGLSVAGLDTRQRSLNLLFSTRVGQNTYIAFGARRVQLDNSLNTSYRENAALASVSLRY